MIMCTMYKSICKINHFRIVAYRKCGMKVDQIVTRNKNDMNFSKKDTQTNWIFTTYTAGCFTKKNARDKQLE